MATLAAEGLTTADSANVANVSAGTFSNSVVMAAHVFPISANAAGSS